MNALTQTIQQRFETLIAPAQSWFLAREPRERWLLMLAGLALICVFWYSGLHRPIEDEIERYQARNSADFETVQWMQNAAEQIRAQGGASAANSGGSLLTLADSSLRRAGLATVLQRIQPEDDNNVKIWLDKANFNTLLRWLGQMESQGLVISVAGITPATGQQRDGLVNARLTLSRP